MACFLLSARASSRSSEFYGRQLYSGRISGAQACDLSQPENLAKQQRRVWSVLKATGKGISFESTKKIAVATVPKLEKIKGTVEKLNGSTAVKASSSKPQRSATPAPRRRSKAMNMSPPIREVGDGALEISVFDIFKIGIGPSSSHTIGPMKAAREFLLRVEAEGKLAEAKTVIVELFGSLSLTGRGHATDIAILLGLEGDTPEEVDADSVPEKIVRIMESQRLRLLGREDLEVDFIERDHMLWNRGRLPMHTNGMRFSVLNAEGEPISRHVYYSIGGGFIVYDPSCGENTDVTDSATASAAAESSSSSNETGPRTYKIKYPFKTAEDLLVICNKTKLTIAQVMMANELAWRPEEETRKGLLRIWQVMKECVQRGFRQEGVLPGTLRVKRRAPKLYRDLMAHGNGTDISLANPADLFDWVSLFAISVNEENAAGSRVVTAPTNGAAGIIPAVLYYYDQFICQGNVDDDSVVDYLLTAAAIAILYKTNASISGAEVGCQGEVGVACSMAAAALCGILGGSTEQVENAAEIGMEHNLGLTCDPVGGLVQVPCIERNAVGSVKAIQAARLSLRGDGTHIVSLDDVIETMRRTGADMKIKYKETSRGGLAVQVTVPEC